MSVMVGVPVKNSAKFLPDLFEVFRKWTYPRHLLRFVFLYGKSSDGTLDFLKEFKDEGLFNVEVYREQYTPETRLYGYHCGASLMRDFQSLIKEDFFLKIDSDVEKTPPDLIEQLMDVRQWVLSGPYVYYGEKKLFYDVFIFRLHGFPFSTLDPPGKEEKVPIVVDSIGTCYLVPRHLFKWIDFMNPFPDLYAGHVIKVLGGEVVALPYVEIWHHDPVKEGIFHVLPPELGCNPFWEGVATSQSSYRKWSKLRFGDPWPREDPSILYDFLDVKDEEVIDVGSDWGSTARFFLEEGASRVVCSEYNPVFRKKIEEYSKIDPRVRVVGEGIFSPRDFEEILQHGSVLKIDCEGAEIHLTGIDPAFLRDVNSIAIETHSKEIRGKIEEFLSRNRFVYVSEIKMASEVDLLFYTRA